MKKTDEVSLLTDELADFLASCPTREEILLYRPSAEVQQRARSLLDNLKKGHLSADEQWELDQFDFAESLLQQVKARLRTRKVTKS